MLLKRSFEPNSFELLDNHKDFATGITILSYKNTNYFFSFNAGDISGKPFGKSIFSPGNEILTQRLPYSNWSDQYSNLEAWLYNLSRELSVRNPWENIKDYLPSDEIDFRDEDINSGFSFDEVSQIEVSLNVFKKLLLEHHKLSEKQTEVLNHKIEYLCETAKRSRKIDWKNIFIGTMINLMITINLNPEQAYSFWQTLIGCFTRLLNFR